jgi:outer membrane protein, heavy metal efflux system
MHPITRSTAVSTIVVALAMASPVRGAEPTGPPLRLADVVAAARQLNPAVAVAAARAAAAAAEPAKASAWDDPVLSWEAWNIPDGSGIDQADNNILKLSQKIPFPGKRGLAGEMARHEAAAQMGTAQAVELDAVSAATRAFWALWQAYQRVRVFARDRELAHRSVQVAEQRYATGDVPQADVLRAQVELTHAINKATTETLAIDSARAELDALLDRTPGESVGVPEDPVPHRVPDSLGPLVARALAHRPELAAGTATVTREEAGVRLAHRDYYPDFEVGVGRFFNARSPDGIGAMASMTIPLAFMGKYDAGVAEANARLTAAQAERRRIESTIRRDVEQSWLRLRTARLQHDLFATTHIPQAEQSLRASEGAYQAGRIDFLALLDAVRAIERAHLEHIDAVAAQEMAYADLERAVGGSLADDGDGHE